jgi:FKBP-type peptidyl-prolyl cis-trans isomerase 2/predicted Fe-Mo cluster-binding NifX family protein
MLIAIPSESTDGLDAAISEHFGHCATFTIITVKDDSIGDISVVENTEHEHGGCLTPVNLLKEHGVGVLLAGGMGMRPLDGFQQAGIDVHHTKDASTVREAVELFLAGGCPAFGEAQTCSGGEGGCGGHDHDHEHHHHEPQTIPIEGTADVREGRMVTLDYELKDTSGNLLDASASAGPMRFIFGSGKMLPAIEQAVAGLEPGATITKEVQSKDGFGDRDESRLIEAPCAQLPPDVGIGAVVSAQDAQGRQFPMTVVHLDGSTARLDGNHPLAGKDLVFQFTVKNVEGVKPS